MDRLLIVADDITGALDTGVQLGAEGASTLVVTDPDIDMAELANVEVLVVDTETRHVPAAEAYETVRRTVQAAKAAGFGYIYKKTDSALRGNIGAELAGVLDGAGAESMFFLPAFPQIGRVTRDGVQYINGVPVAESVFGKDPFEPVTSSSVADIIGQQTDIPVTVHSAGQTSEARGRGIHVCDAASEQDLRDAAIALAVGGRLHVLAGCAGMASELLGLLELSSGTVPFPLLRGKLLTVCGSVNPITRGQMEAAEQAGALRITLTPAQKLTPGWAATEEGRRTVARWLEQIEGVSNAIVECGPNDEETARYAAEHGLDLEHVRRQIAVP